MRKGEKTPRIEKLTETPIEERNGTKIKIYMVSSSDTGKFVTECKKQLAYFDNVYVNISDRVKTVYGLVFNNDYKITEGNHFKLRNKDNPYQGLHLCLGKVAYPIDWNNMGINSSVFSSLNLALKFEIGELPVTFTREDIKYTENSIKTVKNKIKLLMEELVDLYNDQEVVKKDYDYFDLKRLQTHTVNNFRLGDVQLDNNIINIYGIYARTFINSSLWLNLNDFKNDYFDFKINSIDFDKKVRKVTNSAYKELPFEISYYYGEKDLFLEHYRLVKKINTKDSRTYNFGKSDSISSYIINKIIANEFPLILFKDKDLDLKTNKYLTYEVFAKKLNEILKNNNGVVPYRIDQEYIPLIEKKKRTLKDYKNILNLQRKPKNLWRKLIEVYQKTIEESFVQNVENYSKYQPDDKWYKEWKKNNQPVVSYNKTTTNKGEYNLFVIDKTSKPDLFSNSPIEEVRKEINIRSSFKIIKDSDIQSMDEFIVTTHENKAEIGLLASINYFINSKDKTMFVTTTEKNIEKIKTVHKNVKLFEDYIEENLDVISDYYNTSLIFNSSVFMENYKHNYYTRQYSTELTFIEIFNPGSSSFIVDIEQEVLKIKNLNNIDVENLNLSNHELVEMSIKFINKFMESNHPKAKIIKKEASKNLNVFKDKIKANKPLIEKIKFMREISFSEPYNRIKNPTRFEVLRYLDLIDNNCEIIKNYGKLPTQKIFDEVYERIKKLKFFHPYDFNKNNTHSLWNIIEDYGKMIDENEKTNKLIEKV